MIRTSAQYKSAKEFIDKDLELYDYALSEKMTSHEYNLYLQDTQYCFNVLYEKLRTLEDIIEYLDYYSSTKIEKIRREIAAKEAAIAQLTNRLANNLAISQPVTWEANSLAEITDRDGSVLQGASIKNNYSIISGFIDSNKQTILSVEKKSNLPCYKDNLDFCIANNYYIAFYDLDNPQGIEEELEIELGAPDDFDYVEYEPINCCGIVYSGKNDSNHVILKLIANNMAKGRENFFYDTFKESNLNNINNNSFIYNQGSTVNSNQNILADELDKKLFSDYIYEVTSTQKKNVAAEDEI